MTHGTIHPPEKLAKYPHMFPLDIPIWERFIDNFGADFLSVAYDVKVGSGTPPIDGLGDKYAAMQAILSKYRIDVVGFRSDAIWIIETKPDAGNIALGQIDIYTYLYKRDLQPTLPVVGVIVTDRELPDVREFAAFKGYEYFIV